MVIRSVLILPVLIGVMVLLSEPPKGRGEWFESIRFTEGALADTEGLE